MVMMMGRKRRWRRVMTKEVMRWWWVMHGTWMVRVMTREFMMMEGWGRWRRHTLTTTTGLLLLLLRLHNDDYIWFLVVSLPSSISSKNKDIGSPSRSSSWRNDTGSWHTWRRRTQSKESWSWKGWPWRARNWISWRTTSATSSNSSSSSQNDDTGSFICRHKKGFRQHENHQANESKNRPMITQVDDQVGNTTSHRGRHVLRKSGKSRNVMVLSWWTMLVIVTDYSSTLFTSC